MDASARIERLPALVVRFCPGLHAAVGCSVVARVSFVLCMLVVGCSAHTDTGRSGFTDGGIAAGGAGGAPDGGRAAGGAGVGSGGRVGSGGAARDASTRDASPRPDAQDCDSPPPVPVRHRAQREACPTERGTENPLNTAACANTSGLACKSDADCTAGMNGRCLLNGDPCRTLCSYDACHTDADCPSGEPCGCRTSGTATVANFCVVGSSCATDGDCGRCGFCSLSIQRTLLQCSSADDAGNPGKCACEGVESEAYACHTMNDECTNDGDCTAMGGFCAYVAAQRRWACKACTSTGFR